MEFACCWRMTYGSGYSISRRDYLDLECDHRNWLIDRIEEQRREEGRSIRKAREGK